MDVCVPYNVELVWSVRVWVGVCVPYNVELVLTVRVWVGLCLGYMCSLQCRAGVLWGCRQVVSLVCRSRHPACLSLKGLRPTSHVKANDTKLATFCTDMG